MTTEEDPPPSTTHSSDDIPASSSNSTPTTSATQGDTGNTVSTDNIVSVTSAMQTGAVSGSGTQSPDTSANKSLQVVSTTIFSTSVNANGSSSTIAVVTDVSITAGQASPSLSDSPASPTSPSSSNDPQTQANNSADLAHGGTNKGAIAGGVIGAILLLLLLAFGAIWFVRRRRRSRLPASAEFRDYGTQPAALGSYSAANSYSSHTPLNREKGAMHDDGDEPPPFSPGSYTDPLFEKLRQTREANKDFGLAV